MTSSLAKEARSASAVGPSRASSNGRSRENEYGNNVASAEDRVCSKEPLYYEHGQKGGKKLLLLWGVQTYSKILQE